MNNAKMWLVVSPTVGVPIFLGAVAVGSFAVHVAVLSNTTWVSDFLSGKELGSSEQHAAVVIEDPKANLASAPALMDGDRVTIVTEDGRRAVAVIEAPTTLAAADGSRRLVSD